MKRDSHKTAALLFSQEAQTNEIVKYLNVLIREKDLNL